MKHVSIKTAIKNGLEPQSLSHAPLPKTLSNGNSHQNGVLQSREAAQIITKALWMGLKHSRDNTMFRRLQSLIRTIRFSKRRLEAKRRNLTKGTLQLLRGFKFNEKSSLETILKVPLRFSTELETNRAKLFIPPFNPHRDIDWPKRAAFCRIKTILTGIDLDTGKHETTAGFSGRLSRKTTAKTWYEIINEIPRGRFTLLIYCCGIDFYSIKGNNKPSRILELKYNPLEIGAVDYPVHESVEDLTRIPMKSTKFIKTK